MSAVEAENETKIIPNVIPLYAEREAFPKNVLNLIYRKMVDQGLDKESLHGHNLTEEQFVEHLEHCHTHIFLDTGNGQFAGLAWLTNFDISETMTKAEASVMFFKEYWIPQATKAFGLIFLGQVFGVLNVDTVYALTPKPNRMSLLYTARLGFKQKATLENFASYHGKTCDIVVSLVTRDEFNAADFGYKDPQERVS